MTLRRGHLTRSGKSSCKGVIDAFIVIRTSQKKPLKIYALILNSQDVSYTTQQKYQATIIIKFECMTSLPRVNLFKLEQSVFSVLPQIICFLLRT